MGCDSDDEVEMVEHIKDEVDFWNGFFQSPAYTYSASIVSNKVNTVGRPITRTMTYQITTYYDGNYFSGPQYYSHTFCVYDDGTHPPRNNTNPPPRCPLKKNGSIINVEQQVLQESIGLVGTGFDLVYSTDRDSARKVDYQFQIPLKRYWMDAGMTKIYLDIDYDGHKDSLEFNDLDGTNGYYTYTWNGKDRSGQEQMQSMYFEFTVREYPDQGQYEELGRSYVYVGGYNANFVGLGGWTISVHHFYDKNRKLLYKGNGETHLVEFEDIGSGNMRVVDPLTRQLYIFNSSGRHTETRTNLLNTAYYTFVYDGNGFLQEIEDVYGNETTIDRDGSGNLTGITSEYNQTTNLSLNGEGKLAIVTNPASEVYEMTYHQRGKGLLASFTMPAGQKSEFSYDESGRLSLDNRFGGSSTALDFIGGIEDGTLTVTTKSGRQTTYELESNSNPSEWYTKRTATLPSGMETYDEDSADYLKTVRGDIEIERDFTTDVQFYQPIIRTYELNYSGLTDMHTYTQYWDGIAYEPFNYTTITYQHQNDINTETLVFNKSTKTWTNTSFEGRVSTVELDVNERVVEIDGPASIPIGYGYDAKGRLETISQGTRDTTYAYDATGFVSSVTNDLSQTTSFTYDNAGRVTKATLPDSREINYTYDDNGKLLSIQPPGRSAYEYHYGAGSEFLASLLPPILNGTNDWGIHYFYDDDGIISSIQRADGTKITYSYVTDSTKLSTITDGTKSYTFSNYDINGSAEDITSPDNLHLDIDYRGATIWDSILTNNSIPQVYGEAKTSIHTSDYLLSDIYLFDGSSSQVAYYAYTYDKDRLMETAGDLDYTVNATTGLTTAATLDQIDDTFSYNTYGEMDGYTSEYSSTTKYSYSITRDAIGRISQFVENVLGTSTTYDYTYDSAGRLDEVEVNSVLVSENTYDANSNRTGGQVQGTAISATYDAHDRLTDWNDLDFTYNKNGELISKTNTSTSDVTTYAWDSWGKLKSVTLPSSDVVSYTYDGFDRKAEVKLNGTVQYALLYKDQLRPVAQMDSSGNLIAHFVWGSRFNAPEYMVKSSTTYRFVTDPRGSVRLVIKASDGTVAQRIDYDEWGRVTNDTNPGFQPFGFAGGIYDHQTGLVQFGARHYDGEVGRWLSKDPIDFAGGDTNLYGYVVQDPVNFVDPEGLEYNPIPMPSQDEKKYRRTFRPRPLPDLPGGIKWPKSYSYPQTEIDLCDRKLEFDPNTIKPPDPDKDRLITVPPYRPAGGRRG